MNVYVESNFALELTFEQEQRASCEALLELASQKSIMLMIPAFSLVEPYGRIHSRLKSHPRIDPECSN